MNHLPSRVLVATLAAGLLTAATASADDKPQPLTVLPWSGAFLKFSGEEKKGSVSLVDTAGPIRFQAAASVPLDNDTRRAAFVDDSGQLTPGFSGSLSIFYSSLVDSLGDLARGSRQQRLDCNAYMAEKAAAMAGPFQPCTEDNKDYQAWVASHSIDPHGEEARHKAAELKEAQRQDAIPRGSAFARTGSAVFFEAGLDVSFAYDKLSLYSGDIAEKKKNYSKSDFKVGPLVRLYPASWLAITLRGGFESSKGVKTADAKICQNLTSSKADTTGQTCDDKALFLKKELPRDNSFYGQVAFTGIIPRNVNGSAPGAELAFKVDKTGGVRKLYSTGTLFLSPVTGPVIAKFGVALEYSRALDDDPGGDFSSGKTWWTPYLVVGGTLLREWPSSEVPPCSHRRGREGIDHASHLPVLGRGVHAGLRARLQGRQGSAAIPHGRRAERVVFVQCHRPTAPGGPPGGALAASTRGSLRGVETRGRKPPRDRGDGLHRADELETAPAAQVPGEAGRQRPSPSSSSTGGEGSLEHAHLPAGGRWLRSAPTRVPAGVQAHARHDDRCRSGRETPALRRRAHPPRNESRRHARA